MRSANLILHIISTVLLGLDTLFVALNFLMGFGYMDSGELMLATVWFLLFAFTFLASIIGGITVYSRFPRIKLGRYKAHEIIIHSLSALCFGIMIAVVIKSNIFLATHKVRELSTSYTKVSVIDMAGFAIGIAGIIITAAGPGKAPKQANARMQP